MNNHNLYERYTSTSALVGVNEQTVLKWSKSYFRAHYIKYLPSNKDAKILEIGCGYGKYLKILAELGYTNCQGIDISEEQVRYASNMLGLSNVIQANALDWLEGKESAFNCILAIDILEHLETDELMRLGAKMYSTLKPGGTIIIQVPNAVSLINPFHYGDLTHVRAFTVRSMHQFFLHIGFKPIGYHEIPTHIYNVSSAIRRGLWSFIIKPLIHMLGLVIYGNQTNGIYTGNFIAVAEKSITGNCKSNAF